MSEIIRDLTSVQSEGIDIGENLRLDIGLVNISCDNLGANALFGFSEIFAADYFCRFCECSRIETQSLTKEDISKLRTAATYNEQITKLQNNAKMDLKDTKGIRSHCLFNNVENFHVLTNLSVDIMHDICEGIIPFFLHNVFQYCIDKKICNQKYLIRRIRDFNYGVLNSQKKPSRLQIERNNLGQNASQLYAIMVNMYFM